MGAGVDGVDEPGELGLRIFARAFEGGVTGLAFAGDTLNIVFEAP